MKPTKTKDPNICIDPSESPHSFYIMGLVKPITKNSEPSEPQVKAHAIIAPIYALPIPILLYSNSSKVNDIFNNVFLIITKYSKIKFILIINLYCIIYLVIEIYSYSMMKNFYS